jgi:hypothetical protein
VPDRHAPFGYNAREPWAPPRFTGEPTAAERAPGSTASLVALAVLFVLIGGAAYLYGALALF